jgi:hypothetical protein
MITGDLIRIKNMVDDCMRMARSIQREAEHLTPEEKAHLSDHISGNPEPLEYLTRLVVAAEKK